MTPYYNKDGITIYQGNCREILSTLPTVDLLLTDPPYGVGYKSGRGNLGAIAEDLPEEQTGVIEGLSLALKQLRRGRHVYIFGHGLLDLSSLPLCGIAELIWDKEKVGMGNLSAPWGPQHEKITFATYEIPKANRENVAMANFLHDLEKEVCFVALDITQDRQNIIPLRSQLIFLDR